MPGETLEFALRVRPSVAGLDEAVSTIGRYVDTAGVKK
jgi:hypothetical protein